MAELKDHLSKVLRSVEAGETVEVLDRARPIARLTPATPAPDGGARIIPARRSFAELRDMVFTGIHLDVDLDEILAEERAEPDWFGDR